MAYLPSSDPIFQSHSPLSPTDNPCRAHIHRIFQQSLQYLQSHPLKHRSLLGSLLHILFKIESHPACRYTSSASIAKPSALRRRYHIMVTSHPDISRLRHRAIPLMRRIAGYILPAAVSAALIVWLFHKVDFHTITAILRDSCDYRWLLLMCAVLTISRCIRGIRWGLQLRAAGISRMPPLAEMASIFGAYALNLILSGVGEVWRCIYVSRSRHAPISTVAGTDLGDRISDAIMIVALIILSLSVAHPVIQKFIDHYSCAEKIMHFITSPWLWILTASISAIGIWMLRSSSKCHIILRIRSGCSNLWQGFRILFTMKHRFRFWAYTLVIWIAYFLMTYLCFFAFPFTRTLIRPDMAYGLLPGLVVFIFGSLSIAIPATGGLGPWNLAVIFALSLYGVSTPDATAYSIVVWAFQTFTQIILGIVSAAYISISDTPDASRSSITPSSHPQS